MTSTVVAPVTPAETTRGAEATPRRRGLTWLGLVPFGAYVVLFLAIPAVLAVASGFFDADGAFTLSNFSAYTNPAILNNFWSSLWISAVTSILGAVFGALICFALLGTKADRALRSTVDSASSVLAQFGGVMLAFAFIATIGAQGVLTKWLISLGLTTNVFNSFNGSGPLLYQVPGLVIPYLYFQVPLMVLTFMPAMEGLKSTWAEANATLGGTRFTYWTRIGMPILAPAFFGSLILLFANSFSSYATAAALISQGGIIPLAIRQQLTSETIVGVANVAGVLALGMVVVMIVLMSVYTALQRRASRWRR
ncbi:MULTISPECIES: ABC transporter permease [Subtercola]|uniref:ABC transporter permease subunit n=1 Tax=Subtercola vilae TaxID=2056433 RepID=A0A4T2BJH9_9MICO|nr:MULTISPECIES: ABC transporter permease subunit [Subtercola]MEA9986631.1 ABC transporter permease subunit [Subtercola sp. RTI3]TIH31497.1 ABC transporter permease subunit [Subtercola vilae]